jgi:hypothetical protein
MQYGGRALILACLSAVALAGGPKYSTSVNLAVDLQGAPDTRPGTWGDAGVATWSIHFLAPAGSRVRILRVYGDFIIWPRGRVREGTFAGTLFGLQTSGPDGSVLADIAADNCFLYLQMATNGKPERAPFDSDVSVGGLLGADNTLKVRAAVWLNDTGLLIHMEPSWVMTFQIEDSQGRVLPAGNNYGKWINTKLSVAALGSTLTNPLVCAQKALVNGPNTW